MKTLTLLDGNLYYEEKGTGIPLLLLHAGIADSGMWDEQFDAFAEHYRVVRCDLRGYGKSLLPNAQFAYHDDIHALAEALNLQPAWLVGASFGARVAVDFYLSYPEQVKGLVLVSPVVSGFQPDDELEQFNEKEDALLEAGNLEEATELNLRMWFDGPHRSSQDVDPSLRARVAEMQLRAFSQLEPENVSLRRLDPPAIERLHEIRVPTLVISGELDVPTFVELSKTLAGQIPGARRVVVPEAAHMVNMEAPRSFTRLVLEFISEKDVIL